MSSDRENASSNGYWKRTLAMMLVLLMVAMVAGPMISTAVAEELPECLTDCTPPFPTGESDDPPIPAGPAPGPTPSGVVYFGDRPTFDAANPGLPIEDFEESTIAPGTVTSFMGGLDETTNNGWFSPGDILPGVHFEETGGSGLALLGAGFAGNPSINIVTNTFIQAFEITFPNNDVYAAGMDLVSYFGADTMNIDVYGPAGVLIDSTTAVGNNAGSFWGVASTDYITRIVIDSPADQAEGVDNIAFTSNLPPYSFDATPPTQTRFGWKGDYVDHYITIRNTGSEKDVYLPMFGDFEWRVKFWNLDRYGNKDEETWWIGPIPPGGTMDFIAEVRIPHVSPGDFDQVTITVTSRGDRTVMRNADIITRTSLPTPFFDDFEEAGTSGNFGQWNDSGPLGTVYNAWTTDVPNRAGVNDMTAYPPSTYSMYTQGGPVATTTCMIHMDDIPTGIASCWIQRGGGFSEVPDGGEDLIIEYADNRGNWYELGSFPGAGAPGETFYPLYTLPPDALHQRSQIRFRQIGGNEPNGDYWHIDNVYIGPPTPTFDLTPDNPANNNGMGNPVEYVMQIQNNANHPDTYQVTTQGNWPSWGPGGPLGPVAPGEVIGFSVFVDIPPGLPSGSFDTTNIIATSQLDPAFTDTSVATTTFGQPNPILTPDTAQFMGDPGTTAEYIMNIENGAIYADTFDLGAVGGFPGGGPTTILTEDFEGGFPPAGWTVIDPDTTGGWEQASTDTSGSGPPDGTQAAYVEYEMGYPSDEWFVSPPLSSVGIIDTQLQYDYTWRSDWAGATSNGYVYGSTDGGATWPHLIYTFPAGSPWISGTHTWDVSAWANDQANIAFGFHYVSDDDDWHWMLDNVEVTGMVPTTDIWNAAGTVMINQIGPLAPGANQDFLVRIPIPAGTEGTNVESLVTATSQVDNSFFDVSTLTTYSTSAAPLFSDDFADGDYVGWTTVEEGTINAPMIWNAGTGVLRQTGNVHEYDGQKWSGTYAWTGDTSWGNYVYRADLRSNDDDVIGMMGRFTDSNNYYRFMWGRQNRDYDLTKPGTQRRVLDVAVNGVWTPLASDDVIYSTGTWYNVEMQFIDDRIMVLTDGNLVFDVIDGSHSNGAIALYSWGNDNGRYDNPTVYTISSSSAPIIDDIMEDDEVIIVNSGNPGGPSAGAEHNSGTTSPFVETPISSKPVEDIEPIVTEEIQEDIDEVQEEEVQNTDEPVIADEGMTEQPAQDEFAEPTLKKRSWTWTLFPVFLFIVLVPSSYHYKKKRR